jgi:hypothetical protein
MGGEHRLVAGEAVGFFLRAEIVGLASGGGGNAESNRVQVAR